MKPFLDANAVDVVIIDPQWNGFMESIRLAILADTYDVNVAAHNCARLSVQHHGRASLRRGARTSASWNSTWTRCLG